MPLPPRVPQPDFPRTPADQRRLAAAVNNLRVSDIPKPDDINALDNFLRGLGIRTSENKNYDPVGTHSTPRSRHYRGLAFDISIVPDPVNESDVPWANAIFDQLRSKLYAAGWQDIIWKARDGSHRNHMHIGAGPPEPLARASGRPSPRERATSGSPDQPNPDATAVAPPDDGTGGQRKFTYLPRATKNILNQYRSWTYNFAMGVLPAGTTRETRIDRKFLDQCVNRYHIFDSSGKAGKGDQQSSGMFVNTSTNANVKVFLDEFNSSSSGRFDFFVDDLKIATRAAAGDQDIGASYFSSLEFTVIEPYSMHGFIEAMQAAAMAAGWASYQDAILVFKIWFTGYPDSVNLPKPEIIPDSTRYYELKWKELSSTVNEEGTKYQVACIGANQFVLGSHNHHFAAITVSGNTVFDQIRDLFEQLNASIRNERREAVAGDPALASIYDRYEVSFPVAPEPGGEPASVSKGMVYSPTAQENPTAPTQFHNAIVQAIMPSPGTSRASPETGNVATHSENYFGAQDLTGRTTLAPDVAPAQVDSYIAAPDRHIHQVITDIILRSNYVSQEVLQNQRPRARLSATNNFIDYFKIRTEMDTLEYDPVNNRYSRVYRYIVEPYKMHFTIIPGEEQGAVDYGPIRGILRKEYNYMFTGENVDILKFEIKFDNLYAVAVVPLNANSPEHYGLSQNVTPAQTTEVGRTASASGERSAAGNPAQNSSPTPTSTRLPVVQTPTLEAAFQDADPFSRYAQIMHDNIMNSSLGSWQTVDIDILGDPYFLSEAGTATEDQQLADQQTTTTGQAAQQAGHVFINLNFKTMVDIYKSDGKPGLADFGKSGRLLPYSGVYQVANIENNFKGGVFTQRLRALRQPAQIVTTDPPLLANEPIVNASSVPGATVRQDSADSSVNRYGIRPDQINFAGFFNRGLPSVGLPGSPADFTAALAQTQNAVLTQVSGATANFANQLGPDLNSAANSLTSGINISPSDLQSVATDAKAAAVGVAGSLMEQVGNIQDAATNLAGNMINQVSSLAPTLQQEVDNLEADFTQSVGDAKNAVQRLQNAITTDPSGIASKLGIDPAKLSGLGKELASKVTEEFQKVADLVPPNTNLAGLEASGVVFANMVGSKLANLPPLQPKSAAPRPIFDPARVAVTDANGNVIPLLGGEANLAALTEINNVKNSLGELASGYETRLKSAAQVMLDKVGTVQLSVDNIAALSLGIQNPVGGLNQNSTAPNSPATAGLGSRENNSGRVDALVQASSNVKAAQANLTLASQVGSKSATSPLTTLVQNSNIQGKLV